MTIAAYLFISVFVSAPGIPDGNTITVQFSRSGTFNTLEECLADQADVLHYNMVHACWELKTK